MLKPIHLKYFSVPIVLMILVFNACDSASEKSGEANRVEQKQPVTRLDSLKARMGGKLATGTDADKAAAAFGEKIAKEAAEALGGVLTAALQSGNVEDALSVCFEGDEALNRSVAQRYHVKVSRVSHKPRNPNNEASTHEKELIAIIESQLKTGEDVPALKEDTDYFTYYHPIVTRQLCLQCHGVKEKDISELDLMTIQLMYPTDRATGFKVGDVRGLWKISFSKNRLQQEVNNPAS